MGNITRKYSEYFKANKKALTTQIWDIEITPEGGSADIPADIKLRIPEIEGCPPAPEGAPIEYEAGGFKFKYYGKIDKDGSIGFSVSEDEDNAIGKLAKVILKQWAIGAQGAGDKTKIVMTAANGNGDNTLRFKVKVRLGNKAGEIKKTWIFYDAIAKVTPEGSLGNEAGILSYKFDFDYQTYEEDDEGGSTW